MLDVIIVGSGPSGVAAALQLAHRGIKPLILDVGNEPGELPPQVNENLYDHRKRFDTFDLHIGGDFRGLSNLLGQSSGPVKLLAPNMNFVTKDADQLSPIDADEYHVIQSFSRGGLANLWGTGLYRFTDQDMKDFPIKARELDPYLDVLTREIGICGADDDLTPFLGSPAYLQNSMTLSYNMQALYGGYHKRKQAFQRYGMHMGAPRIGVLTNEHDGRPAFGHTNLEFWQESPSIYSPRITLNKLIALGQVEYEKGFLVESFVEESDGIVVHALRLSDRQPVSFRTKKLILATGTINTSRIVLRSFRDYTTRLRLLENPAIQTPFIIPQSIGRALDTHSFGLTQLNLIWENRQLGQLLQGNIMEVTSPLRSEFFANFPFSAGANLEMIKYVLPALFVIQWFFPSSSKEGLADLSLQENGRLGITGIPYKIPLESLSELFQVFRMLGAWSHSKLIVRVPPGHSIHYAGTLPMSEDDAPYTCNVRGKLSGTHSVFVVDASTFPSLPAKNLSLSMMANAMRIVDQMVDELNLDL